MISYYAAKGGVEGLTKGLAVELGDSQRPGQLDRTGLLPLADVVRHVQRGRVRRPRCAARCSNRARRCRRCRAATTCAAPCASWQATSRPSSPGTRSSSTAAGARSSARLWSRSNRPEECQMSPASAIIEPYVARTPKSARLNAEAKAVDARRRHALDRVVPAVPAVRRPRSRRLLQDVDGNRYIELLNNYTSLIHGHAHPVVVEAIHAAAGRGRLLRRTAREHAATRADAVRAHGLRSSASASRTRAPRP